MNRAIIEFTILRLFSNIWQTLNLVLFTVAVPVGAGLFLGPHLTEETAYVFTMLFSAPILPLFIAFWLLSEAVAKNYSVKEGENLSLLFCRPVSRFSYVLSKWFAGSIAVFTLIFTAAISLQGTLMLMGNPVTVIDGQMMLTLLLNSFSYTALVVVVHAFPARIGIFLFFVLFYVSLLGSQLYSRSVYRIEAGSEVSWFIQLIALSSELLNNFLLPQLDVYTLTHSLHFSWLPIVTYVSNILLYLLIATFIINKREFFYAAE